MTHKPELGDYTNTVGQFLTHFYGADAVEGGHVLPSGRRPDFVVDTPLHTLLVEVENDADSAVHTGAGQAVQYAGEAQVEYGYQTVPVVVSPHWEQPEKRAIQQYVKTWTVPVDWEPGDVDPSEGLHDH